MDLWINEDCCCRFLGFLYFTKPGGLCHGNYIWCPTWKVIQADIDPVLVHADIPEHLAPQPTHCICLLVWPSYTQWQNTFGLSDSYKGFPMSVPEQPGILSYIPGYTHPEQHR